MNKKDFLLLVKKHFQHQFLWRKYCLSCRTKKVLWLFFCWMKTKLVWAYYAKTQMLCIYYTTLWKRIQNKSAGLDCLKLKMRLTSSSKICVKLDGLSFLSIKVLMQSPCWKQIVTKLIGKHYQQTRVRFICAIYIMNVNQEKIDREYLSSNLIFFNGTVGT